MRFLDRLLGRSARPEIQPNTLRPSRPAVEPDPDAVAVERYRYLLRTAQPGDLERAHAEAFERLTSEQRDIVRQDLERALPTGEAPAGSDPRSLARAATRAELRNPGTLERAFSSGPASTAMGGSFLQTFAAVFLATSVADAVFSGDAADPTSHVDGFGGDSGDVGGFGDFGDLGGFDF